MSFAKEIPPVQPPHSLITESRYQQQHQDENQNLSPTILSLPPELICKIFISLPTITSILPLTKASNHIHSIWITNAIQICRGRMSSYWAIAEELAILQRKCITPDECPSQDQIPDGVTNSNTTSLADRLLRNELIVTEACDRFSRLLASGQCFPYYLRDSSVTAREDATVSLTRAGRERFHGAYYRYWIENVRENLNGVVGDGKEGEEEGGMKHRELDLRTLFVKYVFLKKRR